MTRFRCYSLMLLAVISLCGLPRLAHAAESYDNCVDNGGNAVTP